MALPKPRRAPASKEAAGAKVVGRSTVIEIQGRSRYVDESPVFPIENGNPKFDFETPRTLRLACFSRDGAVHAMPNTVNGREYHGTISERHPASTMAGTPKFRNDSIEFVRWMLDPNTYQPVRNEKGQPVPELDADGRKIPQPMPPLEPGQYLEIRIPYDNSLMLNLLRNPRVYNVSHIDGIPTDGLGKVYTIVDTHAQQENKRRELQFKQAATAVAADLKEEELFFFFAYLGLHRTEEPDTLGPNGEADYSNGLMRTKIWEYASQNYDDLLSFLRDDPAFHMRALVRGAMAMEFIRYSAQHGFAYKAENGASIAMGLDENQVIRNLQEQRNAHIYQELSDRMAFQDYLQVWIGRSATPQDATPAHPSVLLEGRLTIERSASTPKSRRRGVQEKTTSLTKAK